MLSDSTLEELDCPLGVVEEAMRLASQIEGRDLPMDFDPGGLSWNQNLLRIARVYTNYEALSGRLRDWLAEVEEDNDTACELRSTRWAPRFEPGCPGCPECWLAERELCQAAQSAAERVYQTWLARKALAESRDSKP